MSATATDKPPILVVDDSKLMRAALTKMLREDYSVHEAGNGQEAWDFLQKGDLVQMVFTDLSMPVMDGFGLIKEIRASLNPNIKDLPIVVITGAEEDEKLREQALGLGATEFVTKPFKSTQIKARAQLLVSSRKEVEDVKQAAQEEIKAIEVAADVRVKAAQEHAEEEIRIVKAEVEQQIQQVETQSIQKIFFDPEIHLSNPAYFQQRGGEDVSLAVRHKSALSLLSIRVQHFATLSEEAQQQAVSLIGEQISKIKRTEDCATWGNGGLFYFLMPETDLVGATGVSNRILIDLEKNVALKAQWSAEQKIFFGLTCLTQRSQPTLQYLMSTADQCSLFAADSGDVQLLISSEAQEHVRLQVEEQERLAAEAAQKERDARAKIEQEAIAFAQEQARLQAEEQTRKAALAERERQVAERNRLAEIEAQRIQQKQTELLRAADLEMVSHGDEEEVQDIDITASRVTAVVHPDQREKEDIQRFRQSFQQDKKMRDREALPAYSTIMKILIGLTLPFIILIHKIRGADPEEIESIKERLRK